MGNGIDLKLLKFTKGDIDRTGVFVVLKYKGKNIYPFENAFLFKNSQHAYRMGAIYNPQSYDNIAKFHNELYQNGENAALEQFNTEAKLFLKGLKWFVNTDQCKEKWIIRGTTLSYNKYEQLRIERIYSILNAIRAIAEFDEIFPCARSYIKESLKLLSEFQSPQILALRRYTNSEGNISPLSKALLSTFKFAQVEHKRKLPNGLSQITEQIFNK